MEARIKKWGNSLAIRIPQSLANQIDLRPDLPVNLTVNGTELTISPVRKNPETLEQLLERITEDNRHEEVDFGPAVGEETW
jgi:antitoxin MazE